MADSGGTGPMDRVGVSPGRDQVSSRPCEDTATNAAGHEGGRRADWDPDDTSSSSSSSLLTAMARSSNCAYEIQTLTCCVRSNRRSYSALHRPRSPSSVSKSMYDFHKISGWSSWSMPTASSKMARVRSVSMSDFSSSANLTQVEHANGFSSSAFSYSVLHRSTLPSCISMSTYVLKIFSFGCIPMAIPRIFRAASSRLQRISNCDAMIHTLLNENCLCGISFRHSRYTSRVRSTSPASVSSKSA
mmetsp:Transcript_5045/g.13472  ORF Transcript_5045/g.13472 Transcript_5045/m.13472 type:complete len:245 (+) Transcript_5045:1157-1891(+)